MVPGYACELDGARKIRLAAAESLLYRVESPPIEVSRHFSMRFLLCRAGQPINVDRFRISASMPIHQHGMNYRARVVSRDNGLIETSGMLFHMPGLWQVTVDIQYQGATRQLKIDYRI